MAKSSSASKKAPLVGILMGSQSDWETMTHTAKTLEEFSIPFETKVISAHRAPKLLLAYAESAEQRGLKCLIAGAGGAAHLPGVTAAFTTLPVLGVPVESRSLQGLDALLSIVQMPAGIPVATFAIGRAGAVNAALFTVSMLANDLAAPRRALKNFRKEQTRKVQATRLPSQ